MASVIPHYWLSRERHLSDHGSGRYDLCCAGGGGGGDTDPLLGRHSSQGVTLTADGVQPDSHEQGQQLLLKVACVSPKSSPVRHEATTLSTPISSQQWRSGHVLESKTFTPQEGYSTGLC